MPLSRQGYSGAYFANNGSWAWPCSAQPDDVRPVLLQEVLARRGEPGHVVEQRLDLRLLLHERVARRHAVAQHRRQLRHHRRIGVRHRRQLPQVVDQQRDLRVHPLQVVIQHHQARARPCPPGPPTRRPTPSTCSSAAPAAPSAATGRCRRAPSPPRSPPATPRSRPPPGCSAPTAHDGTCNATYFSPNNVFGTIRADTFSGIRSPLGRVDGRACSVDAVAVGLDPADLAHAHAADLHVREGRRAAGRCSRRVSRDRRRRPRTSW